MGIGNIVIGRNKADSSSAQAFCNVHTLRYGLKSGPVRRASTGVSPLLSLWLPSPEVAVKSLAVRRKSVHQTHRVATLFVVTFVNREGDTPVPPHRHATSTPHTSNFLPEATLFEGGKPLGFVAYPMSLRSVIPHRVCNLPYRLRFGPQEWESMARTADQSFLKSHWSHASEMRCTCSVCFFVLSRLCSLRTVAVDLQYVE